MKYIYIILVLSYYSCAVQNNSGNGKTNLGEFEDANGELVYFNFDNFDKDPCLNQIENDSIIKNQILNLKSISQMPLLRRVIKRNIKEVMRVGLENQSNTELHFNVYVTPNVHIMAARYLKSSTALIREYQKRKVLIAICGYQYEPLEDVQCIQTETLKIVLQHIRALNNK